LSHEKKKKQKKPWNHRYTQMNADQGKKKRKEQKKYLCVSVCICGENKRELNGVCPYFL